MAETADIAVIDGEDIEDVSPWEFDSITEEGGNLFTLQAIAAIHGIKGYCIVGDDSSSMCYASKFFAEQSDLWIRQYIKFADWDEADGSIHSLGCSYDDASPSAYFTLTWHSATSSFGLKLSIRHNGGIAVLYDDTAGDVLTEGNIHFLEIGFKNGEIGIGGWVLYIDDVLMASDFVSWDTTNVKPDSSRIGFIGGADLPLVSVVYFDDIKATTTGPIGPYSSSRRQQPIFLFE